MFPFFFLISCNSNNSPTPANPSSADSITATPATDPVVKPQSNTIESFILDEHKILASQKTDFNNDGFEDVILLLKQTQEEKTSNYSEDAPTLRPLLFLAGDSNGSLQLVARNDKAVYCFDCGGQMGDPFNNIIVNGSFVTIEHYGGSQERWARIITFQYDNQQKEWLLYEDNTESFQATKPQEGTQTEKTSSAIPFESFDIYQ